MISSDRSKCQAYAGSLLRPNCLEFKTFCMQCCILRRSLSCLRPRIETKNGPGLPRNVLDFAYPIEVLRTFGNPILQMNKKPPRELEPIASGIPAERILKELQNAEVMVDS